MSKPVPSERTFPAGILWALLVAGIVFVAIAPTLSWLQFSGGSENLNAATVQEIHRGGPWVVPFLNNKPRLAKPPLTAWISATAVSAADVKRLDVLTQPARDQAYNNFAFKLRWPALLAGCVMLVAIYALGRAMDGGSFGLTAAMVAGSSILFLRFVRSSTTDIQLAMWVSVANAIFAWLVFGRLSAAKRTGLYVALGASLGFSLMSKGPVGIAQTVLPWAVFALLDRSTRQSLIPNWSKLTIAIIVSSVVCLAIALPWVFVVVSKYPNALELWRAEVTREGATTLAPDPWYSYFSFFIIMMPWVGFFIAGLVMMLRDRGNRAHCLSLCLLIAPVLVMSFARDKNDRYLLPMLPAAAVVVAFAMKPQLKALNLQNKADLALRHLQLGFLILIVVGLLICGASGVIKTADQQPWYSWAFAISSSIPLLAMIAVGTIVSRRKPWVILPLSLFIMLAMQAAFIHGYAKDKSGRSEMKQITDAIMQSHAASTIWYFDPRTDYKQMPQDLNIYLNRLILDARDLATLDRAKSGDVAVVLQREKESAPQIPGWQPIASAPWGKRFWWAFEKSTSATLP